MNSRSREKASHLRQEIRRVQAEVDAHLDRLLGMRRLLKGSIYEWKRKCGSKNCHCRKGDLHSSWVFSRREGGELRKVVVTENEIGNYRKAVDAQRTFRAGRSKVIAGQTRIRGLLRDLEEDLRIQVPVGKPKKPL